MFNMIPHKLINKKSSLNHHYQQEIIISEQPHLHLIA